MSMWVEAYSIDEAFVGLRGTLDQVHAAGQQLKREILRLTGLPVCVGIAKTKTLAKLANQAAKKIDRLNGLCVWDRVPESTRAGLLSQLPVGEVWGIGPRMLKQWAGINIGTIKDFLDANETRIGVSFPSCRCVPCWSCAAHRAF